MRYNWCQKYVARLKHDTRIVQISHRRITPFGELKALLPKMAMPIISLSYPALARTRLTSSDITVRGDSSGWEICWTLIDLAAGAQLMQRV